MFAKDKKKCDACGATLEKKKVIKTRLHLFKDDIDEEVFASSLCEYCFTELVDQLEDLEDEFTSDIK